MNPTSTLNRTAVAVILGTVVGIASGNVTAQTPAPPAFALGTLYECSGGQSFRVISCTGTQDADACDVQTYSGGQPNQRGPSPRAQVLALVPLCRATATAGAPAAGRGAAAQAAPATVTQVGPAGIKVGDTVEISTAFGPMNARVLSINGNSYRVLVQNGAEVVKIYPAELRRIGPLTAYDRANGIYQLKDKVQVLFEGRWVDSEVITTLGMEYQVTLPGNRVVWAKPENLRLVAAADTPVAPAAAVKAGQPPRPGLTSCAGKIEGRYAASNGLPYTMEFRSGKVTVTAPMSGGEVVECWMSGGKIYLHMPGDADDIAIDINDDGTLQTPFGEMRKRGG